MKILSKFLLIACVILMSCDVGDEKIIQVSGELSYFPIEVGYRWEYEPLRTDLPELASAVFTVVGKETRQGREYFAMERRFERQGGAFSSDTIFYRVDAQGFVFELFRYDTVERNRFRLEAADGETWEMQNSTLQPYIVTTQITDVNIANGVLHECKSFGYDVPQWADEEHYIILARGLGIVQHGGAWGFDYKLKSAQLGAVRL